MIFGDWVLLKLRDPRWHDTALCLVDYVDAECCIGGLSVDDVRGVLARTSDDDCTATTAPAEFCECEPCTMLSALVHEWEDPEDGPIIDRRDALHSDIPSGPGVYFLGDGDLVKVGVAADVRSRFATHRSSNLRLFMFAVVKGDGNTEVRIHDRLRPYLIRGEREWFTNGPAVEEVLKEADSRGDLLWSRHR